MTNRREKSDGPKVALPDAGFSPIERE
jgi:hypothetical protein